MSAGPPPVLRVTGEGGLEQALAAESLRAIAADALARYLNAQRWFGGKARTIARAWIADVVPVRWDGGAAAVTRVVVTLESADGGAGKDVLSVSYQLPLIVREAEMSRDHAPAPNAVLAMVDAGGLRGALFDALHDPEFRRHLGVLLLRGATFAANGASWTLDPVEGGDRPAVEEIAGAPSRLIGGEQSNTSIVYGDRAIFKWFRRLEPGENPDVEITRFLTTRTAFRHTPELWGTTAVGSGEAGGTSHVGGMLTRYLPGATDGWAYALDHARSYLRASKGTDDGRERTRSEPPREPPNPFTGEAERLGRITRELHEALTSDPSAPGFAPEPVTKRDVERWGSDVRRMVDEGLDLLRSRLSSLDANTAAMARAIAGRGAAVHARVEELEREARREVEVGGRMKVRHHGDYHLGQVLRTSQGDWMIIDFEGEPARPLAERRAPSSPTRDVAGMLRSFAYAAATGIREAGGGGGAGARVNTAAEIGGARWERDVRAAFLSGYGVSGDDPLVALFEMEKVFYELLYELNNRPGWAWIPLRGIARVF